MKKNILLILTDQHKYDALSLYGQIPGLTPNLDSLAAEGVNFTNTYSPCPVCGPARASIFTGVFPGDHGVIENWRPFRPNITVLPEMLEKIGYKTFLSGKLHFTPHKKPFGFTEKHLNDAPYSVYCR